MGSVSKDHYKYKVIRKGKRDYRPMIVDILAFEHKIFQMTDGLSNEIRWPDFKYLCALNRLTVYKNRSITSYELSIHNGFKKDSCLASLRRMSKNGLVVEISSGHWEISMYGNGLISRYNGKANKFLSGKISDPNG